MRGATRGRRRHDHRLEKAVHRDRVVPLAVSSLPLSTLTPALVAILLVAAGGRPDRPTATRLVFASDRSGSSDLWVVDADGSNLHRFTDGPADDRQAWWSPDGKRIVFARYVWLPDEPFYTASEILEIAVHDMTAGPRGTMRAYAIGVLMTSTGEDR